jgi:glucose dehydrogenase
LKLAWRFHTENLGPKSEYNMEDTPLMVGGVVYTTATIIVDISDGYER